MELSAQVPAARLENPAFDTKTGASFHIQPPADRAHRIDFTSDFLDWYPLQVLPAATPPRVITDADAIRHPWRFYRSVEVEPVPAIYGYDPDPVAVGESLLLRGQFFSSTPSQNRVTLAGQEARVLEASPTTLRVQVPVGARSGLVRVTTPQGSAQGQTDLTVEDWVSLHLAPPAGYNVAGFRAGSSIDGTGVTNGTARLRVARGVPSVVMALPGETNRPGFLAELIVEDRAEVTLDAQSTARALLFLNLLTAHGDPLVAGQMASVLQSSPAVPPLGQAWARALLRPGDPIDDPEVVDAYTNAVAKLLQSPALQETAQRRQSQRQRGTLAAAEPGFPFYHEPPQTRWLELALAGGRLKVSGVPFNPVDWVVKFQELDVDRAFVEGRFDFQSIVRQINPPPTPYPLRPGFSETRTVSADLAASRINFVSYLSKELFKTIAGSGPDDSVPLFRDNTIYLMRGVGPSFNDALDYDFNTSQLLPEYQRAIAVNIVAALIDAVSAVLDFKKLDGLARSKELKDWDKFYFKLVNEAVKQAPNVRNTDDFLKAVAKLSGFFFKELIGTFLKEKFEPGNAPEIFVDVMGRFSLHVGKLNTLIPGLIDNKYLKAGSSIGQVVERASGLLRTTPLETAFVVVGDPFKLNVGVNPSIAGLGDEVVVTLQGSSALQPFRLKSTRDQVNFEGPVLFNGEVLEVIKSSEGSQRLRVRVPADLPNTADGSYTLFVNTQGRKGSTPFRVALRTMITDLVPDAGFAAAGDFAGSVYPGSSIAIQGVNLSAQDVVLFSSPTGTVAATTKSAFTGGLRVNVPSGALSGPIRVDHRNLNGQISSATSHVFKVLGPPSIVSMVPESGPPGTLITFQVENLLSDNGAVRVQFPLGFPSGVILSGSNQFMAAIPINTTSGPVRVITPAGVAERPLVVTAAPVVTNLQFGSTINVGGKSVVTLERAVAIANGEAFPEDDTDYIVVDGHRTELDPPYEEGDFIQPDNIGVKNVPRFLYGQAYSDTVVLTSPQAGNVVMRGANDRLSASPGFSGELILAGVNQFADGTFHGAVRITGNFNYLSGNCDGTVVITGNSNRINGHFSGPVIVEGDYNLLGQEFSGTVTLLGQFNQLGVPFMTVHSNAATAVVVRGDHNTVSGDFLYNEADVVVVDGASFTSLDFNNCNFNAGHGLVLQGGASFNTVVMRSGVMGGGGSPVALSGNGGNGVWLRDQASQNTLSGEIWGNGLDGLRLEGPGVHHNRFTGQCLVNGGNGITVLAGAHHNSLGAASPSAASYTPVRCDGNGLNGIAILGGLQTSGGLHASRNQGNGLLFSGVDETTPQGTYFVLLTAPLSADQGNGRAGLRMEGLVRGVTVVNPGYRLRRDAVGVELDGPDVTGNTLDLRVSDVKGDGAVLRRAARNTVRFEVTKAAGAGVLLDGAEANDVRISAVEDNQGPGVLLTGGAAGNVLRPSAFSGSVRRNRTGIRIEAASHDNQLDTFDVLSNGDYGLVLTGAGTRNNVILRSTFGSAAKDGVLMEDGASDNTLGSRNENPLVFRTVNLRDNGLTGVRITGAETRGNKLFRCFFQPSANTIQPAGLLVEKGSSDVTVTGGSFFRNGNGLVVGEGAGRVSILGARFQSNNAAGILISNAANVVVGGPLSVDQNEVFQNPIGIQILGGSARDNQVANNWIHDNTDGVGLGDHASRNLIGASNRVELNVTGVRIDAAQDNTLHQNLLFNNQAAGVILHNGASGNRVLENLITANAAGVHITGAGSIGNTLAGNSIHSHPLPGSGIILDNGGNGGITPPELDEVQSNAIVGTSDAPDGSRVELFLDSADEGEVPLASGTVVAGRFRVAAEVDPILAGFVFNVTGTVTDPDGNTSGFGILHREEFPESRLVYASTRSGNSEIYGTLGGVGGAGGGLPGEVNLSLNPARDESPALAEGCDQVLFVSDRDGNPEIYKVELKRGASALRLTTNLAPDYDPSWLVPCLRIVFVSERDGDAEIYRMDADGSNLTRLTRHPSRDRQPRVSPDGTRILFVSDRSGADALWIMDGDGGNPHLLVPAGLPGTDPAWSPNGLQVAFVSTQQGNSDLYVVGVDGQGLVRLTTDAASDVQPAWVPGGEQVLFSSNRTGNYEIYAISRQGGLPRRLTVTLGDNFAPAIQRR